MAGIKQPITDILSKLATIQVTNADNQTVSLYSRIWNNQIEYIEKGSDYVWPRPAAFVEVANSVNYKIIGLGFRSADLGITIHLVHDFFNSDGTFEQDLDIFDLRDQVVAALSQYSPTACSPLNCINEDQDYSHDNLYHYVLEFVCNSIDSKGSAYDPSAGNYDDTPNINMDQQTAIGGIPTPTVNSNPEYIIP